MWYFLLAIGHTEFETAEPATNQICFDFYISYEGEKNVPNILLRLTTTKELAITAKLPFQLHPTPVKCC
jgi:hypothetical protein